MADPAIGVGVIGPNDQFRFANAQFAEALGAGGRPTLEGEHFRHVVPSSAHAEWSRALQHARRGARPVLYSPIILGRRCNLAFWPFDSDEFGPGCVLCIQHRGESGPVPDRFEVIESAALDLGPLEPLTSRELDVLALIGRGLSNEKIARTLHRSRRTVENHRLSIARKLGVSNRVALAQLAQRAGLSLEELARQRPSSSDGQHTG